MSKPKLIFRIEDSPNFNQGWIRPLVDPYFDMVEWNPNHHYSVNDAILTTYQQDFDHKSWFRPYEKNGHPIVVDHLFDSDTSVKTYKLSKNKLELRSPHWMWYRTALLMQAYQYNQYSPQPCYTHNFLCLMNKLRDHRDYVMTALAPELGNAKWSYVERGIQIGDPNERTSGVYWAYYNNPNWYDSTVWSLVVESYMRGDYWFASPESGNYKTEISEKSYKPIAYYHPLLVIGSVDTLKFLHSQGFETFDNLWTESYDDIVKDRDRLDCALDIVRQIVKTYNTKWVGWDKITQEKLAHNHNRFFDFATIQQRFTAEIIHSIKEFLE